MADHGEKGSLTQLSELQIPAATMEIIVEDSQEATSKSIRPPKPLVGMCPRGLTS